LEGVIVVTFLTLDPDAMGFRHTPMVDIGKFYHAIMSQMINRCRVVKWLTILQQLILKLDYYTASEYILIISNHQPTSFLSPVLFDLCME
jgi:hypothetical protein